MHPARQHLPLQVLLDPDVGRPVRGQGPSALRLPGEDPFHLGVLQDAMQQAGIPETGLADLRPEARLQDIGMQQIVQQFLEVVILQPVQVHEGDGGVALEGCQQSPGLAAGPRQGHAQDPGHPGTRHQFLEGRLQLGVRPLQTVDPEQTGMQLGEEVQDLEGGGELTGLQGSVLGETAAPSQEGEGREPPGQSPGRFGAAGVEIRLEALQQALQHAPQEDPRLLLVLDLETPHPEALRLRGGGGPFSQEVQAHALLPLKHHDAFHGRWGG